jgi:hypothetical protein
MANYTEEEISAYETLVSLGLDGPIAEDCIASRTSQELKVVTEFLDRYGACINGRCSRNER